VANIRLLYCGILRLVEGIGEEKRYFLGYGNQTRELHDTLCLSADDSQLTF